MSERPRSSHQVEAQFVDRAPASAWFVGAMLISMIVIAGCGAPAHSQPKLVCFSRIGDDGLTLRMSETFLKRARKSDEIVLGGCSEDNSLFVLMRAPEWTIIDSRTEARPTLEVRDGQFAQPVTIGARCWDDEHSHCVDTLIDKMMKVMAVPPNP